MAYRGQDYNFNSYSAGNKVYGLEGRSNPTSGPVDILGYRTRDLANRTKRNALLRRLKRNNSKQYMSSDWLGGEK